MNQPLVPQGQPGQQMQTRNLNQMLASLGPKSALASQSKVDPKALAAGIKPAFASVTFKGKTWGIRHRGQTHPLLVRDPQSGQVLGAAPSIDIVILKSAVAISKAYYIEKYKENDNRQPDCWSTNGMAPDPAAPRKQSPTCRGCQWDAFGSRMTEDNRKGKACGDAKRLAVVPAADIKNEFFGGPMLLKLPPSAFAGFSELEAALLQQGYEYFAVVMRLTFDHQAAYPKIVFTPIGVLDDYQMTEVLHLQEDPIVERILSEELFEVSADPNQPVDPQHAVPQQAAQPQPVHTGIMPQTPSVHAPQAVSGSVYAPQTPLVSGHAGVQPYPAHQPQPQPVQAFNPVAPVQAHQPPAPNGDGMDIPPHLQRQPQGNGAAPPPAQAFTTMAAGAQNPAVQQVQPQAAPQPVQTAQPLPAATAANPEAQTETPEQTIARLEAALAAAQSAPKRQTRKRAAPITPSGGGTAHAVPQGGSPLPLTTAQSTQPSGAATAEQMRQVQAELPGETIVDAEDDDQGDAPADLDSRIDALMGTVQQ